MMAYREYCPSVTASRRNRGTRWCAVDARCDRSIELLRSRILLRFGCLRASQQESKLKCAERELGVEPDHLLVEGHRLRRAAAGSRGDSEIAERLSLFGSVHESGGLVDSAATSTLECAMRQD